MPPEVIERGEAVAFRNNDGDLVVGRFSHVVELNSGAWVASISIGAGRIVSAPLEDVEVVYAPDLPALEG